MDKDCINNAIALFEELVSNLELGSDSLFVWAICSRALIEQTVRELEDSLPLL